jgi:hypothetical protein
VIGTRILFGWYASRRARTGAEGYFLGGRNGRVVVVSNFLRHNIFGKQQTEMPVFLSFFPLCR